MIKSKNNEFANMRQDELRTQTKTHKLKLGVKLYVIVICIMQNANANSDSTSIVVIQMNSHLNQVDCAVLHMMAWFMTQTRRISILVGRKEQNGTEKKYKILESQYYLRVADQRMYGVNARNT
jgi:hypothetical protein